MSGGQQGESGPDEQPRRGALHGWGRIAAVALIVLIVVGTFVYVYPSLSAGFGAPTSISFTFPPTTRTTSTSHTTTTTQTNLVKVEDAIIVNDTLSMKLDNEGTVWTKTAQVLALCTPGFKLCSSYSSMAGKGLSVPFYIGPGDEYYENITDVCVVPRGGCHSYEPINGSDYYMTVGFTFASGPNEALDLTIKANNTYPVKAQVAGIQFQLLSYPKNGSGALYSFVNINVQPSKAKFIETLFGESSKGFFTVKLLSNFTACGGKKWPACENQNLTVSDVFSSVTTGIGTPFVSPPFMLTVRDLNYSSLYFACWVTAVSS